jgi:hypothetical protein
LRTKDLEKITPAIEFLSHGTVDPQDWIDNKNNIVLENSNGDLAIFEFAIKDKPIYSAHYYFKSRGREAIKAGKAFLDELFNSDYGVNVLMGMVPDERKDVKWMTRQLGLKSYGPQEARGKLYELFIITKEEFNNG